MKGYPFQRILDILDGWSQGMLAGASLGSAAPNTDRYARALAVADVLSVLIPIVRPELKPRPGALPETRDVLRILDALSGWAAGVLASADEAHTKTRLERMVAVADVIQTLVGLVRPEVRRAAGG
ncbi:MAG TPA: hypothetical protein VM580_02935 [Labilithrix sp.]|nr:hypothetical protein [Labilithrix sp.]